MHFTPESFRAWPTKRITLLGMSGVGKTYISSMLRGHDWFHFSGDYRIGTRYLDEPILDLIKQQAMQVPFLRDLLRNDWIDIKNNIKIHDLGPVLTFVGKLGGPEWGGLSLDEFSRRQAAYRDGEIAAMRDVPGFIRKGQEIYGYPHFVNDVGGTQDLTRALLGSGLRDLGEKAFPLAGRDESFFFEEAQQALLPPSKLLGDILQLSGSLAIPPSHLFSSSSSP